MTNVGVDVGGVVAAAATVGCGDDAMTVAVATAFASESVAAAVVGGVDADDVDACVDDASVVVVVVGHCCENAHDHVMMYAFDCDDDPFHSYQYSSTIDWPLAKAYSAWS